MGFSTTLLLLAVVHAVVGVATAQRFDRTAHRVSAGLGAAAATTTLTSVIWVLATDWFRIFALAHVAYLSATVTVPLLAAVALVTAARTRAANPRRSSGLAAVGAVGILPAALGLYATHIEPKLLRVDQHEFVADTESGFRIGVMSDVQNSEIGAHERDALQELIEADIDLLLVPGDLWQMHPAELDARAEEFRGFIESMTAAIDHVVFVEGDTDNVVRLRELAEGTGAHVLGDELVDLTVGDERVRVGGVTLRTGGPTPAGASMLASLGSSADADADAPFTILLSHRPDAIRDLAAPVDLVVAGHTHGGQIAIPGIGPLVTFSQLPRSAAAGGLHDVDGQSIYVSTGVGLERGHAPQARFSVRPSVGVIDVVPADQSADAASAG